MAPDGRAMEAGSLNAAMSYPVIPCAALRCHAGAHPNKHGAAVSMAGRQKRRQGGNQAPPDKSVRSAVVSVFQAPDGSGVPQASAPKQPPTSPQARMRSTFRVWSWLRQHRHVAAGLPFSIIAPPEHWIGRVPGSQFCSLVPGHQARPFRAPDSYLQAQAPDNGPLRRIHARGHLNA
ncbi:hypothetical protein E4U21_007828 [Claviceps maximensis]|nr:hypothetical protein E4U21_007828 [Claviceps maximensis]